MIQKDDPLTKEIRALIASSPSERRLVTRIYELVTRERQIAAIDAQMAMFRDMKLPRVPKEVEVG